MKRVTVWAALLSLTLGGCGVEWFPESTQTTGSTVTTTTSTNTGGTSGTSGTPTSTALSVAAFTFFPTSATGVQSGSQQIASTTVSMTGTAAPVSISGGEYQVNSGDFVTAPGTVDNGDQVTVRHTAAPAGGQIVTTLTIGDKSATFTSTTESAVAGVSAFVFSPASINGVGGGITVTSSTVTVSLTSGSSAAISVTGGEYQVNSGSFTSVAGTVNNGDTVRVQHTTASVAGQRVTTTLTIGDKSATFSSTATTSATP